MTGRGEFECEKVVDSLFKPRSDPDVVETRPFGVNWNIVCQAFVNTLATNGVVRLQIIDTARVPDQPVAPKPKLVIGATVSMLALTVRIR